MSLASRSGVASSIMNGVPHMVGEQAEGSVEGQEPGKKRQRAGFSRGDRTRVAWSRSMHRISFPALALFFVTSCQITVCSVAGGTCDPRNANCPKGYTCSLAEVCTHACEQTSDCWIKV